MDTIKPRSGSTWIAWVDTVYIDEVDHIKSYWPVPYIQEPSTAHTYAIYTGVEDQTRIVQPVLEFNFYKLIWSIAAWSYGDNYALVGPRYNVSVNDVVNGDVEYCSKNNRYCGRSELISGWRVTIYAQSGSSSIFDGNMSNANKEVVNTLEQVRGGSRPTWAQLPYQLKFYNADYSPTIYFYNHTTDSTLITPVIESNPQTINFKLAGT